MSSPPSSPTLRTSSHKIIRTYKSSAKRKSREGQESSPKDLSALFENVGSSPNGSPSTPRKLRRMLTKTESLGHVERKDTPEDPPFRPSTPTLSRSASLPSTPSKTPQHDAKKTYGRNRTLLGAGPSTKASYVEMRKTLEIEDDLEPTHIPKAVSEMRSKGETRQFLDEIGYLADAIADSSTSMALRRSSAVDLLTSMLDTAWIERMDVCGQTDRIWNSLVSARGDDVIDHTCLFFLALFVRFEDSLLHRQVGSCTSLLLEMLRKSLAAPSQLQLIQAALNDAPIRRLASSLLIAIPDEHYIPKVIKAFQRELQPALDRFDLYRSGLDLLPDPPPDLEYLSNLLEIIANFTVDIDLVTSIPFFSVAAFQEAWATQCLTRSLKMLATEASAKSLNVRPIVGDLARVMIRRQELESHMEPDDILCAVLALYNASDVSEALCTTRETTLCCADAGVCGDCLRSCHCISKTIAEHLLSEYTSRVDQEDGSAGLIAGYIALILARILIEVPNQQKRILFSLPGSSRRDKITKVLSQLDTLQDLQVLIERHTLGDNDQEPNDEEDILRGAISGLKQML